MRTELNPTDDLDLQRIAEAFRAHLKDVTATLASIDRIIAWCSEAGVAGVPTVVSHGGTMDPTGLKSGKTLTANAYALLAGIGRPTHSSELAAALKANGVASRSSDFENCLNSLLGKKDDMFVRISPKMWALVEWGPSHMAPQRPTTDGRGNVIPFAAPNRRP